MPVEGIDLGNDDIEQRLKIVLHGAPDDGFNDIVVVVPKDVADAIICFQGKCACFSRKLSGSRREASDMISSARDTA